MPYAYVKTAPVDEFTVFLRGGQYTVMSSSAASSNSRGVSYRSPHDVDIEAKSTLLISIEALIPFYSAQ